MKPELKFINYMSRLSTPANKTMVESIIAGYKHILEANGIEVEQQPEVTTEELPAPTASSEALPQTDETQSQGDGLADDMGDTDALSEATEVTNEIVNETPNNEVIVKEEQANPELVEMIKALCEKTTALYKHLTGVEFGAEEEENEEKDTTAPKEDEGKGIPEKIEEEPILEAFKLQSKEAVNDVTGTDYSRAFNFVYTELDNALQQMEKIYATNMVVDEDKLLENAIPMIDQVLNVYMDSFARLEKTASANVVEVVKNSVSNTITTWIHILKTLDTNVNLHHDIQGVEGRKLVELFRREVIEPALELSTTMGHQLISSGEAVLNKDKIVPNISAILKQISALISKYKIQCMGIIKVATGGKHYTKTGVPA